MVRTSSVWLGGVGTCPPRLSPWKMALRGAHAGGDSGVVDMVFERQPFRVFELSVGVLGSRLAARVAMECQVRVICRRRLSSLCGRRCERLCVCR